MENINEDFSQYMKMFKTLPLKEKQAIIYEQLKTITAFTQHLCTQIGKKSDFILNKEILDIKNPSYTEDDFLEAMLVFINSLQNSICDYSGGITDILNRANNN